MSEKRKIKGVVVAVLSPTGETVETASNFDQYCPAASADVPLDEWQRRKASRRAWRQLARKHCSDAFAEALIDDGVALQAVAARLTTSLGWYESFAPCEVVCEIDE